MGMRAPLNIPALSTTELCTEVTIMDWRVSQYETREIRFYYRRENQDYRESPCDSSRNYAVAIKGQELTAVGVPCSKQRRR